MYSNQGLRCPALPLEHWTAEEPMESMMTSRKTFQFYFNSTKTDFSCWRPKKNFRLQISGFKVFFCSVRSFLDPGVSERERIIEFKVGVLQKKLWNSCRWLHGESFYNSVSALEIYYRPNLPYILSPNGSLASFCTSCLREANIYLICTSFWACLLEKAN